MSKNTFGSVFLKTLAVCFFVTFIGAGVFLAYYGKKWLMLDLELSVRPMLELHFMEEIAWGMSILSSVSEIIGAVLLLDLTGELKRLQQDAKYRTLLPILNEKTVEVAKWFCVGMSIYDLGTNIMGMLIESPEAIFPVVALSAIVLTFCEYLIVIGVALVVTSLSFSLSTLAEVFHGANQSYQ